MKYYNTILISLVLLIMSAILVVGYAALTDHLSIEGSASVEYEPYWDIYISNVSVQTMTDISSFEYEIVDPTNLKTHVVTNGNTPTVTLAITVHNQSNITYWYHGVSSYEDYGQNSIVNKPDGLNITTNDAFTQYNGSFDTDDWVPQQTFRTFYATYTFGTDAHGEISTMVNYAFGLHIDSVKDNFLKILNDKTSDYGYNYLSDLFNDNNGSTVIGQVGEDKKDLDVLFGTTPTVNMNGEEQPVTIMIQRIDVDNRTTGDTYAGGSPAGCEYTVYITVDDVDSPGSGTVTVYAATYTCGADGVWYQIGELYEGTAKKVDYDNSAQGYQGAFDVESWVATPKTYYVTNQVYYEAGKNGFITIEDMMSKDDINFYNSVINNMKEALLIPACNTVYVYSHKNDGTGGYNEYVNTANQYKPGYNDLKKAYDIIAPYCLNENGGRDVRINPEIASKISRAELVRLIKQLKTAYDYYCEVNPQG